MKRRLLGLVGWVLVVLLSACSATEVAQMPPQQWQGLDIELQTRPTQITAGMNEFLIIATSPRGIPGSDMVVSLGRHPDGPWSQAIQDGHTGVYRRAYFIKSGQQSIMLQLVRGEDKTVLVFELLWPE